MSPHEYISHLQGWLERRREVLDYSLGLDVGRDGGYLIRGVMHIAPDLELHVSEYWASDAGSAPNKYRYHLQEPGGALIARWDNAPHHPHLKTFPHHVHHADGRIEESFVHDLYELLIEMRRSSDSSTPA